MKGFIEVIESSNGFRVFVSVKEIKSVLEMADGTFIETDNAKRNELVGIHTTESYEAVTNKLYVAQ